MLEASPVPEAVAAATSDASTRWSYPDGWDLVRLGDLFDVQQGKALSARSRTDGSMKPFLRTSNVSWGRFDLGTLDTMGFRPEETERLALKRGDLLVCEGGDIGRTAVWGGEVPDCYYQNHLHRLRARSAMVCPEFFMYWLQAAFTLFGIYAGTGNKTTIPNLSRSRLASLTVPVPPFPEQLGIAQILSALQQAIDTTEAVITAIKELKRSLIRHLVTWGPVPLMQTHLVAVKETEIGAMPEDWRVAPLHKVLSNTQYGLSQRGERTGEVPILRMNNLQDGSLDTRDLQYVHLSSALEKFKLNAGDVLFNRTNSQDLVGKVALFEAQGQFVFASYLIRLVCNTAVLVPEYLSYYLNCDEVQRRLKGLATRGVSQSNISASKLRSFLVAIPPVHEQRRIARIMKAADSRLGLEAKCSGALKALFTAILSQLMTGAIRLTA